MPRKAHPDGWLLLAVVLLVSLGLVMIYSASAFVAEREHHRPTHYLLRQAVWAAIGTVALLACYLVDYRVWRRAAPLLLAATCVLLVMALVPGLSAVKKGARRWVDLGPLAFQPSELAKFSFTCFLSAGLVRKRDRLRESVRPLWPELAVLSVALLLVLFEPDLGSTVILATVLGALLFVGGLRLRILLWSGLAAVPLVAYSLLVHPYQRQRILTYLDPWSDAQGKGFQAVQAFLALGRGGVTGLGPAESRQKLFFLPEPHTDFILAVIGEEFGFWLTAVVVLLFAVVLLRGARAALRAPDLFGCYLAFGLTVCLALQMLLNAGVVTGLLPTKGLTLPFLSYGGTSLLMSMAMVGVLLNISQHAVAAPAD